MPNALRLYLYLIAGSFLLTLAIHIIRYLYLNGIFVHGFSRVYITHVNHAVIVRINTSRPLNVRAGQYISLWIWIPSVSFWSFLQSHPFVVASWADGKSYTLDLLIEPRRGLTRKLLDYALTEKNATLSRRVLFSGPHGITAPVEQYENVLMIASGYGLAAQLPYIKYLIYKHNVGEVKTRRVRLVWQIPNVGKYQRAESSIQCPNKTRYRTVIRAFSRLLSYRFTCLWLVLPLSFVTLTLGRPSTSPST